MNLKRNVRYIHVSLLGNIINEKCGFIWFGLAFIPAQYISLIHKQMPIAVSEADH